MNNQVWPSIAVRLLMSVRDAGETSRVRYRPSLWLQEKATPTRRQRWSRWTRRLATAGLLERICEPSRDRVTHVRLPPAGLAWLDEHVGGATADLNLDTSWFDSLG
jgi:hypothetical protein